jgi:peptidoglycan/xylan/chitin deacetylase (PgdA/CDA1 family)
MGNGMKHFLRDIFIFLVSVGGVSFVYRRLLRQSGPLVRVLVFHDVADATWFLRVIEGLASKYHMLTPSGFHEKKFHPEKINVLLTFDDGYASWVDVCMPVLAKYSIKGLFFVSSGILDCADDEKKVSEYMRRYLHVKPKRPLTKEGAKRLAAEGHVLGGHTIHHPNLALLAKGEVEREVIENKQTLESLLGTTLVDFAYPFGRREHRSIEALMCILQAGYTNVYTADAGFVGEGNHEIPRLCIEKGQSIKRVQRWVEGGYDIFQYLSR